ncbi:MAG: hypothetical protein OXM02_09525 [Bacteroidota bacterium]|nr:hypothetical protein [Bacteroidota bacterium]MDE2834742.1 hypothetical protein [Bacteroidota bacterium]MDE2956903.1 hypothetical protein [Bacteroidota bacterium]
MKRLILLAAVLILTGASVMTVRLAYFTVDQDGGAMILSWETEVEADVRQFELFRKTSQGSEFHLIATQTPRGIGQVYRYRDSQMYRSPASMVDYRLEVVFTSGVRQQLGERKVNYTSTAARRSWGSIKAMFQN